MIIIFTKHDFECGTSPWNRVLVCFVTFTYVKNAVLVLPLLIGEEKDEGSEEGDVCAFALENKKK